MKSFEMQNTQIRIRAKDKKIELLDYFQSEVDKFKNYMPLMLALGNQDLRERHWNLIL